jgi:hypothetical protein
MPALAPIPFVVGISGVLKKTNPLRLPPGTQPYLMDWDGLRTRCEGYALIGAHPRRKCPAVRRDGWTALMWAAANDNPTMVEQLVAARADLNTKDNYGCAHSPSARPAMSSVADCADCVCAVRQVHSAAQCGVERLHQIRRGAARRRRRPDRHEQPRVTLCFPQRRGRARTPNRPESAQEHASPIRTSSKQARRVRRGDGGGAAAGIVPALLLRPGRLASDATSRTQHCTDRALRPTPTHPRHDVRVGLCAIRRCYRTAAGRAVT